MKKLIINADDFCYSKVFNEKILELIEEGLITSTTVMINWADDSKRNQIERLINLSKEKNISIGLHLEFKDDSFRTQIEEQFNKFKKVFGFKPSHLDLHKYTYLEASYPEIHKFCKENDLPCRNDGKPDREGILRPKEVVFDTVNKNFKEIEQWIKGLEEEEVYEILFHPGEYDPESKTSFNKERERDVEHVRKLGSILEENNIKLISFLDL